MSETEKTETKAFNIRAKVQDHEFVTNFLKGYEPKHVGFSALCELVNVGLDKEPSPEKLQAAYDSNTKILELVEENKTLKTQLENQPLKEVHQNLNDLFDFDEYSNFVESTDTSILESIKRGLEVANQTINEPTPTPTAANFVPAELVDKVNLLHRDLLIKKKIPESTQAEYLHKLLTHSLKYYLLNEYPNIYNR